ncbi:MAG: VanZ family protein [Terriglobales bacterium]
MIVRILKAWLPVAAMCVVIFLFSQDPHSGRHSDDVLSFLLSLVGANTPHWHRLLNGPFRKFAHVVVYFILGALAYRGFSMGRHRYDLAAAARSLLFCVAYAATDEYHQSLVPGRGPSPRDVLLDSSASLLALVLLWVWMRSRTKAVPALQRGEAMRDRR